jgi:hypothetical protein
MASTSPATTSQYPRPKPCPAGVAAVDVPGRRAATSTVRNATTASARSTMATPDGTELVLTTTEIRPNTAPITEPSFSGVMPPSIDTDPTPQRFCRKHHRGGSGRPYTTR